jgi:hypothetical protein
MNGYSLALAQRQQIRSALERAAGLADQATSATTLMDQQRATNYLLAAIAGELVAQRSLMTSYLEVVSTKALQDQPVIYTGSPPTSYTAPTASGSSMGDCITCAMFGQFDQLAQGYGRDAFGVIAPAARIVFNAYVGVWVAWVLITTPWSGAIWSHPGTSAREQSQQRVRFSPKVHIQGSDAWAAGRNICASSLTVTNSLPRRSALTKIGKLLKPSPPNIAGWHMRLSNESAVRAVRLDTSIRRSPTVPAIRT